MMEQRPITGHDGELLQADQQVNQADYAHYTGRQVTLFEVPFTQLVAALFHFQAQRQQDAERYQQERATFQRQTMALAAGLLLLTALALLYQGMMP